MIFDDFVQSDSNALVNDVDYSIYESSPEDKRFFEKVLGLRVSVSDDTDFVPMEPMIKEEDQTVPTKISELPFSSVASPASVLGGDWAEPLQENIRAPPPSYEEHKVFSNFHPQNISCEDMAARWQDIQDIITRESNITGDVNSSFSVLKATPLPSGPDDPFQSPPCSDISRVANTSDVNSSIAQSPAWYSTSVQESSFYLTSPESSSLVPPPRSNNSSPASTVGSFVPSYNNYSASPNSNPNFYDPSSRCTSSPLCTSSSSSSPLCKQNTTNTTTNNNNSSSSSSTPTPSTTPPGESGMICGMSYQQLKAHIPESGHIQLWQFLIKLLCEPANENCIRWEGIKGHFTIVNQNELAKRWGERKRRKHMTYEKLSRAIRYYYDKNYVHKIHGKKATYIFNFEELFKSQSRPSQQKSKEPKETNEISGMSPPIKIPTYQNSPSSSSSASSSFLQCPPSSTVGSQQSVTAPTYSPEMNSFVDYCVPQQSKKMKTSFDGFGNRGGQQYFGQEQEYAPNVSYSNNFLPYFDEDNLLSYY